MRWMGLGWFLVVACGGTPDTDAGPSQDAGRIDGASREDASPDGGPSSDGGAEDSAAGADGGLGRGDSGSDAGLDAADAASPACPAAPPATSREPLLIGPVTLLDGAAYVVHSTLGTPDTLMNTSNIVVVRARESVVVFGAGYGDPEGDLARYQPVGDALRDAHTDAAEVGAIITGCFGEPTSPVDFVVPHGHLDHVNEEFIDELDGRGHRVRAIYLHERDERLATCSDPCCGESPCERRRDPFFGSPFMRPWSARSQALVQILRGGETCGVPLLSFPGPGASTIDLVKSDSGHTPGTLDLRFGELYVGGSAEGCDAEHARARIEGYVHRNILAR